MSNNKTLPPLKIDCFHCQKLFTIKYVRASNNYSQKNNWGYWTENKKDEKFWVCDNCLVKLYRQCKWDFQQLITNEKKRTLLRQYLINGTIQGQVQAIFTTN